MNFRLNALETLAVTVMLFSTPIAEGAPRREAPVSNVRVTVQNGGINPDAVAYDLSADALIAENHCLAQGLRVKLKTERKGRILTVTAVISGRARHQICPSVYQPIYRRVTTTVRAFASRTADVVVRNIEELGSDRTVADLLSADADLAQLTGTILRVMAIGGESTGTAIMLADGSVVEINLVDAGLAEWGMTTDGAIVALTGRYVDVAGVEILTRRVLIVDSIRIAGE